MRLRFSTLFLQRPFRTIAVWALLPPVLGGCAAVRDTIFPRSTVARPAVTGPAITQPAATESAVTKPARPAATKPAVTQRAASKPEAAKPAAARPATRPKPAGTGPTDSNQADDRPAVATAKFGRERPSWAVKTIADWVVRSGDNARAAFFIVDKANARLYVFEPKGRLKGAAPILLGLARGDDSVPGIGEKPLEQIPPRERTTPAGRFVAERGYNLKGEDIVWVDYAAAVSLHRVRTMDPGEQRLRRLQTATPADNRISYGCINVPTAFYDTVVDKSWSSGGVIVYVLPESRPLEQVFPRQRSFLHAATLLRRGRN